MFSCRTVILEEDLVIEIVSVTLKLKKKKKPTQKGVVKTSRKHISGPEYCYQWNSWFIGKNNNNNKTTTKKPTALVTVEFYFLWVLTFYLSASWTNTMLHSTLPFFYNWLASVTRGWCFCSLSCLKAWQNHHCPFSVLSSCQCCTWVCFCTWEVCGNLLHVYRIICREMCRLALQVTDLQISSVGYSAL